MACAAQQAREFEGTWVFRAEGGNVFKLQLSVEDGRVTGSLTRPEKLTIDQDGEVTEIGPNSVTLPVQEAKLGNGQLELTIDGDRFVMTLAGRDRASLHLAGMRPWRLERAAEGETVNLAASLPEPDYPAGIRSLREELRAMVREDQDARLSFSAARIRAVDAKNRGAVLRIYERHGWVTNSLAGRRAAHDFWLLVQHQEAGIQRRLLPALERAAREGNASMSDYAYLYDRVQVGLGKPQRWGTHTTCREGKPVLNPVEDPDGLEARRKELFLLPVEEYLKNDYLMKVCAQAGK